ncbi:MAG: DUF2442 domain-containing protein [Kouleothrix sp.]|jgi:hypothetical protein|nr:DUF2442 domain-containing protein [Kouleothrix sp.]
MIRVKDAQPLEGYSLRITFTNGEQRDIDVTRYISGGGIFALIHDDPNFFRQVRVELGTIAWPNGADIDPDVLYLGLPPNASEEAWRAAVAAQRSAAQRAA